MRALLLLCLAAFAVVEIGAAQRLEAIRIATLNADLVVVQGDPATRIADIENVTIVFKDGIGYDPGKLLVSVRGHYGEY